MAIRQPKRPAVSLQEFLALPETEPASELIDGEVVRKPVPKFPHANAQSELIFLLRTHTATTAGKALAEQGHNVASDHRVPDVSWFAPGRMSRVHDYPDFAPDLAVEIRSPGQTRRFLAGKLQFMRDHGSIATMLVDPADRTVEVHDGGGHFVARESDNVVLESLGGFHSQWRHSSQPSDDILWSP